MVSVWGQQKASLQALQYLGSSKKGNISISHMYGARTKQGDKVLLRNQTQRRLVASDSGTARKKMIENKKKLPSHLDQSRSIHLTSICLPN